MNFWKKVTCSTGCAQALREDRRLGLIYGPYRVPTITHRFATMEEWAAYADECVYCRAQLPRGRAGRIQAELDAEAIRDEQEHNYNADIAASLGRRP